MPIGEPVVFIHGWGAMPGTYSPALRALRQHRRLYAPILPGHGGRGAIRISGEGVFPALADDVVSRVPVDMRPAAWVGHSLGGGVAIHAALRYPELVSQLILVCPVGGDGDMSLPGFVRLVRGSAREARGNDRSAAKESAATLRRLLRHPIYSGRVGLAAKYANFERLLAVLSARGIPIRIYTAVEDHVTVPLAHIPGVTEERGPGRHSWPVEEPGRFAGWLESRLAEKESLYRHPVELFTVREAFA